MSAGDTRLRAELDAIPLGAHIGWTRYDTDTEHVLSVWTAGETWDIRVPKVPPPDRPAYLARSASEPAGSAPDHAPHFDPDCEECAYLARPTRETLTASSEPEAPGLP